MPNIYTKDEASRRICAVGGATNTARSCITGECMAWVDEVEIREEYKPLPGDAAAKFHELTRENPDIKTPVNLVRIPVKTGKGYCGLVR